MRRCILLACLLLLPVARAEAKPPKGKKAALKVLNLLKQVDGAGSGLDADMLRGMTPADLGGSRLVVKDSQGKVVGAVIAPSGDGDVLHVVRSFGGQPVVLAVTADGFTNDDPTFALYYGSTDCTGPPLIQENGVTASRLLLPVAGAQGGVAYYASGAIVAGESGSAETFDDPASCDPALVTPHDGCCTDALVAETTSPAATVTLGSLGLVPPFHVEGP